MPLIVEDGTLVEDADSYNTLADLRAYATKRGVTLPVDDTALTVLAIKAMDYIESLEPRFKGTRVESEQSLSWPRKGAVINGFFVDEDAIPKQLVELQCQLVIDGMTVALQPNGTGRIVKKQKVDVIETEYEILGDGSVELVKANGLIAFLVDEGSFGFTVPILRV
jgi:hypothetical protein